MIMSLLYVVDIDECKEKLACHCPECQCKNKWGGYDCKCKGDLVYIKEEDTCIGKKKNITGNKYIMNTTERYELKSHK